jgi:CrcB protein
MKRFFLICLAGALGTGTRYLIGLWADKHLNKAMPWGTLLVNVGGCFLIALLMELTLRTTAISPSLRLILATGFLGGLTTYSSFNYDSSRLLLGNAPMSGVLYVVLTLGLCFLAGMLGMGLARVITGRP